MMRLTLCIVLAMQLLCWTTEGVAATQSTSASRNPDAKWQGGLKQFYFGDRPILDGADVIALQAPQRAEDGAVVPLRITAGFAQTPQRSIKTLSLIIDNNPVPLAGTFHFTQASGKADLALRVRVNEYSQVRVVAETNDGALYMTQRFVKASGGCSAPAGSDLDVAMQRLGKIRFKVGDQTAGELVPTQLAISHPNLTGLQKDQVTLLNIPAHFVNKVKVTYQGEQVFSAETDISVSENPNFRFYFVPEEPGGELLAEIEDSNQQKFTQVIRYAQPGAAQ